ncbi:MAG: 50S ribosomal protein L32e [Candidatus Thermoplasmatota archaeon]|nr:50S ribosomal protein L32e [Candidatus Thermoplasmatota archaeon]MBU1915467.1 50S ribosomal protein L32e [Candidatus Thermoplasmatota archaeon]
MFKEEYIAKLEAIGIGSPKELAAALEDVEKTKEIRENLKGAGPKTIEHWKEDLKVRVEPKAEKKEEEKPAPKTRKVKTAPKKASEEKETKKEEKEPEEPVKKMGKGEKEEEEVEIEEEGYQVKLKPKLSKETIDALRKRAEVAARRPEFLRQEWHRRKRLQTAKWRRPRGGHSKMRQHYGYRPPVVSIGYGSPREARFLHPSGFREVMVYNVKDLAKIRPEQEAARVAHSVGMKKRLEIEKKADELNIRVLNRSG